MAMSNHSKPKLHSLTNISGSRSLPQEKPAEYTDEEAATPHLRARILGFDRKIHGECNLVEQSKQIHNSGRNTQNCLRKIRQARYPSAPQRRRAPPPFMNLQIHRTAHQTRIFTEDNSSE
jgi:hypothetical protein